MPQPRALILQGESPWRYTFEDVENRFYDLGKYKKFQINKDDPNGPKTRTEFYYSERFELGSFYHLKWTTMITEQWPVEKSSQLICQLFPDDHVTPIRFPQAIFCLDNGRLTFLSRWQEGTEERVRSHDLFNAEPGVYEIDFKFRLSMENDGHYEVWINGIPKYIAYGIQTAGRDEKHLIKLGLYRWMPVEESLCVYHSDLVQII